MARKQTSGRLNRFLDLIGLVDSDRDDDMEQTPARTPRSSSSRRANADEFDEFDEFDESPRPRRTMPSTSAPRRNSRINLENDDEFGEAQGWTNTSSGYAGRTARTRNAAPQPRTASSSGRAAAPRSGYRSQAAGASSYERRSLAAVSSGYRASEAQSRYRGAASYAPAARREAESYDMAPPAANAAYQRHQTIIFMLHSVDECKEVILSLIDKKTVLLNLDELDAVQAQRALDTMSGATYAIGATLSRASDRTWLITPSNVEVERSSMDADGYN